MTRPDEGTPPAPIRDRLRADLVAAMKARRIADVAVLRTVLAAIDNAGAVEAGPVWPPVVNRSADVPRRELTEDDVRAIVAREIAERHDAAAEYRRLGRGDEAERLTAEAELLAPYLEA